MTNVARSASCWQNPNNRLGRMLTSYSFESGNKLPKGAVIEVETKEHDGWVVGYWREKGTCFAVELKDVEIIEEPVTPKLFEL